MEDGLFDIRFRDGWAIILLLGIGSVVAWHCQSESRFSFFLNVSATSSRSSTPRKADIEATEAQESTGTNGKPFDQP
jgi:hypothetical protein